MPEMFDDWPLSSIVSIQTKLAKTRTFGTNHMEKQCQHMPFGHNATYMHAIVYYIHNR